MPPSTYCSLSSFTDITLVGVVSGCGSIVENVRMSRFCLDPPLGSTNLVLPKARTNLYGIDTVRFVDHKVWQSVPKEIKESQSLDIFKGNIKAIPLDCSCKVCKSYIANLGFL